ncbi:MAG: TonB-dependent receptor [Novosphingobium sp.]|nr:TonB-dependent receptor [Novosphingobium sp.]MBO9601498.1 TonB-dependent receptor [Novosphingobium sp.]
MHASHFNRKTLAIALLASSSLVAATPAFAEDKTDDGDAIIVTAQKREQNLQDVPASVTALSTKKLEDLQVNELADMVKFLPSVTIQTAGPGFSQVYFRGVSSGENANHSASLPTVGTYLDEMPITTIQGALDIQAYDLARVEALAGPQGTLYGASSMAGTVKMVTNKPDMTSTYGAVDLELNQVQHGGVGGIAEGFLNLRLTDTVAARLVGWYRHDAGYIDNIPGCRTYPSSGIEQCNTAYAKDDYNDADTYGGRLALGIDLDDNWTLRPTVMGQIQKVHGTFAQERSSAVTKDYQTVQYNYEYSQDKWLQAAMTIEGKLGNWDLVATGGQLWRQDETYQDYSDYAFFYDSYYHSLDPASGYLVYDNDGNQISPNQYIQGTDRYRKSFGEVRISSPADAPIRFIGGVFAQRQTHYITQHYIIDGLADESDDPDQRVEVPGTVDNIWLTAQKRVDRDLAAFGELSYDLTDKLTLTAGGRIYYYKNSLEGFFGFAGADYEGPSTVSGAPYDVFDKATSDTGFIHKLNATYKITPDVLVYATWSRGFRPGGINRRGTLPPYGPDTLDNYEVGWKTQFGPITFNGAIYQEDWKHIQLSFLGANGLTEIRDAGIARIRGIEGDLSFHEGGLTLGISGSYNDAKITRDFCEIANADFDCTTPGNSLLAPAGTQLPVTPKIKGNALARYEFPIGDWKGHIQMAISHTGKRRNDLRPDINAIVGNLAAYTTADFSLGFDTGAYRAEIFATNLFGSKGVVNSSTQCDETICGDVGDFAPGGGVFYDTLIKPRLIGIKVGADF